MCLTMYRVHQSEVVVAGILNVSSSMVSTTLRGAGMKRGQGGRVYVKYRVIVGGRSMPLVDAAKLKGIKYQSIISKSREGGISPCEAFSQMEAA
ncbi:MAG: hypothetical protein OEV91_10785 [Desulfobulbaceae bacterium]|nr:hypothetical protein [Desulfobulbaceae bacterium]